MATTPATLWEVHIRVPPSGQPLALACKRGGESLTRDIVRPASPCDALRIIEVVLSSFATGDRLFITARGHDSRLSMWTTGSRSAGLYWCATALSKLWLPGKETAAAESGVHALPVRARTVA